MQTTENNPASLDSGKRYRMTFFLLLGVVFLFRLWFVTTVPLSGDEAYHWEWSRHLAFVYYDHPGLTAYLIFLCTSLFGGSTELTVRLGALLMLTGTSVVCFLLARQVTADRGGSRELADKAGLIAGALIIVIHILPTRPARSFHTPVGTEEKLRIAVIDILRMTTMQMGDDGHAVVFDAVLLVSRQAVTPVQ